MEPFDEQKATEAAWVFLRSNTTASLKFNENMYELSYVIAPDGRLVISAMVAMLQPCDTVMFIPEYEEGCMELHVSLTQFIESGADGLLADRWKIYHGEPPDVQWAVVDIDAARFHELFIDGEGLCKENPLASIEHAICKECNDNFKKHVREVCLHRTNVDVTDPVVVGVDPLGIDVRAPFGIIRIPTERPFASLEDVMSTFNR